MPTTTIKIDNKMSAVACSHGAALNRSAAAQIEHWARIGKIMEENPHQSIDELNGLLIGLEQAKAGFVDKSPTIIDLLTMPEEAAHSTEIEFDPPRFELMFKRDELSPPLTANPPAHRHSESFSVAS